MSKINLGITLLDYVLRSKTEWKSSINTKKIIESHLMYEHIKSTDKRVNDLEIIDKLTILKVCRYCLITWETGMFSVSLEPRNLKQKALHSLLNRDFEKLNKFQKKLVKKCQKSMQHNFLVVKCHYCNKKTRLPVEKPQKIVNNIVHEQVTKIPKNRKKHKKKKDICAGLNPTIVKKVCSTTITRKSDSANKSVGDNSKINNGVRLMSSTAIVHKKVNNIKSKKTVPDKSVIKTAKLKKLLVNNANENSKKMDCKKKSLLSLFLDSL